MNDAGRLRLLLVLGMLTAFGPMSIDMYLPALPALARNLGSDAAGVQLTLSSFFVGLSLGQLAYGPLADRIGRRPPLIAGIALFVVASAGCAMAGSLDALIAWRALQAAGACAGMVISRAVVRDRHAPEEAARVLSLLMLVMGLAPILAPLAGGWVLAHAGWRAIFWVLVAFGVACLIAVLAWLPETRPAHPARAVEGDARLAWYRLLADRRFLRPTLGGALAQAGMFAYISASPFVFIEVYGVPAGAYGWLFGSNALGLIAASQWNRRLLSTRPMEHILKLAHAANAICGVLLVAVAATGVGGLPLLMVPLFGYIASLGLTFPNAAAASMASFPRQAATASSLFGTIQFALAAVTGTLAGRLHDGTALPMAGIIAACGLSAVGVQWMLGGRRGGAR
jgi:DHA1 family bicyclomycin/chloramphenicol resistance-like MFS transporter